MKTIFLDTGPIITLSMNNLLSLLAKLRKSYSIRFMITNGVKAEAIDTPLNSKKFKFEAIQIYKTIKDHTLEIYQDPGLAERAREMLTLANSIFMAHDSNIKILHYTEMETVSAAILAGADAVVVDEFITRMVLENPARAKERLEKKLHVTVSVNSASLTKLKNICRGLRIIRSTELVTVAFERGLMDEYLVSMPDAKKMLLDGLLWGLKLNGCSISADEIDEILSLEKLQSVVK